MLHLARVGRRPGHARSDAYPGRALSPHDARKHVVKLEKYCSPWELQRALARFVEDYNHEDYNHEDYNHEDYNHRCYPESLQNVTPADVYPGRRLQISGTPGAD